MRAFPYVSWTIGILAFWVAAKHAGLSPALQDASPSGEWAKHLLYLLYATGLVLPAMFGPQDRSLVRRLLRFPPLAGLGVISYGIYLWHQAWLHQAGVWLDDPVFQAPFWQIAGLAFVTTVLTATASYWLVEKPFLRLKDRRRAAHPELAVDRVEAAEAVAATTPAP
jgi:peptidoglycan/LPS O-acetylase OafA/YrhL